MQCGQTSASDHSPRPSNPAPTSTESRPERWGHATARPSLAVADALEGFADYGHRELSIEASRAIGSLDQNVEPRSPLRSRDLWCRASMHYRRASRWATNSFVACGRGAVGSAQPCQGWGRGFESRRPLDGADASTPAVEWPSGEATACKAVHTGSIPVSTSEMDPARLAQRESASLTRKRSLVQSQYRAPRSTQVRPGFYRAFLVSAQ